MGRGLAEKLYSEGQLSMSSELAAWKTAETLKVTLDLTSLGSGSGGSSGPDSVSSSASSKLSSSSQSGSPSPTDGAIDVECVSETGPASIK